MLVIISPAKTLDMTPARAPAGTQPGMAAQADALIADLRKLKTAGIKKMMGVSDAIADLNAKRFKEFVLSDSLPADGAKQACLAFDGPAYKGFDASTLSDSELEYAQNHMRILCGLYGSLRPLDLIQPYRLEMGCKGAPKWGGESTLYDYWGTAIADEITAAIGEKSGGVLVNCASTEYSKAVLPHLNDSVQLVECVFKDDGRIKSVYAKRARGLMARWIVQTQPADLDGLRKFDLEGYRFSSKESNEAVLVFNRSAGSAAAAMKRKAPQATKKTAAVPAKAKKKKTK